MILQTEILIAAALSMLTFLSLSVLWLMLRRPQRWTLWVERENNFWRDKGMLSPALAERLKGLEKGRPMKILAGIAAAMSLVGLSIVIAVLIQAAALEHRKPRLPFNPLLQGKPANAPKPKPN